MLRISPTNPYVPSRVMRFAAGIFIDPPDPDINSPFTKKDTAPELSTLSATCLNEDVSKERLGTEYEREYAFVPTPSVNVLGVI